MLTDDNELMTTIWSKALTGSSRQGREIVLFVSHYGTPGPLNTLIFGAFHGDEPESMILSTRFMTIADLTDFQDRRVGIVPVVNPDGLEMNQRMNASGVDLNRNFPTKDWEELNQDTIYYSGPSAASEPETQFMLRILELYPPEKIISVHTPYRVLNYDGPGKELADAMAEVNHYPVVEDIGYATPGSFGTYVGKERNIPTVTVELSEKEAFTPEELENNLLALKAGILYSPSPNP